MNCLLNICGLVANRVQGSFVWVVSLSPQAAKSSRQVAILISINILEDLNLLRKPSNETVTREILPTFLCYWLSSESYLGTYIREHCHKAVELFVPPDTSAD